MLLTSSKTNLYYGYWLIVAAFVTQFVAVGVQNYVIGPFMIPMTEALSWSRAEFTLPRTIGSVVMAVTGFLIGTLVDRHGSRRLTLTGSVILAVSLYLTSFVTQLWQWVLLNGLGLTIGAAMVGNLVVNVTLSKWFVEIRGRAVALAAMGVSFAGVVITPLMTLIIDREGWRHGWRFLAVASLLMLVPAGLALRRAPEDHGLHPDGKTDADVAAGRAERAAIDYAISVTRREALRQPTFYLLVLAFTLFTVNIGVMLLQTVPYMTDVGYPRSTAALMITVASVPAMLSKPIWGIMIDRLDAKPLAAASSLFTAIALLLIISSVQSRAEWLVYAGYFIMGCGWGGMIPLQEVIWASFFGRRHLGAVRSAALPFSLALSAGAPLATSYYHDVAGEYDGALYAVAAASLLSAVILFLLPQPQAQHADTVQA